MEENKCIIKNCGSTTNNLFCSPTDEEILKKWQNVVKTTETSFLVCQNHFASKDIVIEKYLEPLAVPNLEIIDEQCGVDNDTCGICLEKFKEDKLQLSKQNSDNFKLITGYEPVKVHICESCNSFLETYQLFKTEIMEKHKKLRSQGKQNEDSDDDCVVVTEVVEKPLLPKSRVIILPPSIISTVKKLDDGSKIKAIFRCKHCYYKTNERKSLIDHIDENHYYPCKQCPFISSNKPLLTLHVNKFHTRDKTSIICGICDKSFADKSEIDDHYEKRHDEQTCSYFMCFYCKTNCKTGMELKYHYSQFHSNGLTSANSQINNTKLQLALLIGKKERKSDESKEKSYNDLMDRIKSSVTVKKVCKSNKKKLKMKSKCLLPLNTPIPIKYPDGVNPKPGPKITEVTIVSNSKSFLQEVPDPMTSSDEEVVAEIVDTISLDSDDSEDDVPLKKIAASSNDKPQDIKSILKDRVKSIKDGTLPKPKEVDKNNKDADSNLKYVFRCFSCNEYYDDVAKLLKHREEIHPPIETLKSYEQFDKSSTERKKPKPPEGGLEKVACDICSFLVSKRNLQKHKQLRHAEKQYLCHICSKEFADQTAFRYHMMKHEPETCMFQCDMCSKSWVTKGLLAKHIKRTHLKIPDIKDQCPICKKKLYKNKKPANILQTHMNKYHPDGKDDGYRVNEETNYYDCEKCGASYWDIYTFSRHSCEKGKLQIRCLDCMMPCANVESLAKHKVSKCRKINPFTNSVGLKDLASVKDQISENPRYQQQTQNAQQQQNVQVQPQNPHLQSLNPQIQSQQFFHFHPQYQPQFFTNYQH